MLRKFIKAYLDFSARERKGVIGLLVLIVVMYAAPFITPYFVSPPVIDHATFVKEVDAYYAQRREKTSLYPKQAIVVLHAFDPNTLDVGGWMKMGLREKTAQSIVSYTRKGGRFRRKEDLQKIYSLGKADYERLLPFVKIAAAEGPVWVAKKGPQPVDINTADSLDFDQLPGIGPGFARRILRFREKLGGFYDVTQIAETYGMPDSVFVKIQPFLRMGSISLRKIDLNHTDEKSLAEHPYINTKLAAQIVRYRSVHGPFGSTEALKQLPLVDDIIYRKIENYITVK